MGLLCDLQLDNVTGNYQAGDVISGRIALTLQERVLMKALALKISGYAGVGWVKPLKEKKQKPKKSKDNDDQYITAQDTKQIVESYINREDYISTINYFIGSEAATPKIIDSGSFLYNFSARLPEHCPATFDSQIGHIRYELDVFIDFPDRRHTCMQRAITVQRPIDLRLEPTLMQPAEVDLMEHVKFGKFWQRPLQLHADITQSGYVPGEVASVHVKIENEEALKLTEIVYKLNQVGHYTGVFKKKVRVKTDTRCLQTHVHPLYGQSMTSVQHLQSITIPYATPGTLDSANCKCIQLLYEIEVLVQTANRKRFLRAVLPIKVGTISLKSNLRVLPPELGISISTLSAARSMDDLSSSSTLDAMHGNGYVPTAPRPDSPSLAASMNNLASSFREADFMIGANLNKNKKHAMSGDKLDFKPKYLVYDMESANNQSNNAEIQSTAQPSQIPEEPARIYPTAPELESPEEPVNHWTSEKAALP